jgi:hypothetical protein
MTLAGAAFMDSKLIITLPIRVTWPIKFKAS